MKNSDLKVKTNITDLENALSIYKNKDGNYIYNLNETVYLNIPTSRLEIYIPDHPSHWPLISYKLYNTTRLAWLLMKVNHIDAKDVFKIIPASMPIYYVNDVDVRTIIDNILN